MVLPSKCDHKEANGNLFLEKERKLDIYPLKFHPIPVKKVWGGRRLDTFLNRSLPGEPNEPYGETWEIADFDDARSTIANGPHTGQTLHNLITQDQSAFMGDLRLTPDGGFPLLVKFLDACDNLSVQVHPDEHYAASHPEVHFKSEGLYILEAEPGAVIYKGVREGVTREHFQHDLESGRVIDNLIAVPVKTGDCHFLPSGTCHTLGAGVLAAEIQTPSDTTFRLWDWGRTHRTLHIEQGLECMKFGPPDVKTNERKSHIGGVFTMVTTLCTCEHFTIEKVRMSEGYGQEIPYNRPAVWIILEGAGTISKTPAGVDVPFTKSDVLLLPAGMEQARVDLNKDTIWLDIQFPRAMCQDGELLA